MCWGKVTNVNKSDRDFLCEKNSAQPKKPLTAVIVGFSKSNDHWRHVSTFFLFSLLKLRISKIKRNVISISPPIVTLTSRLLSALYVFLFSSTSFAFNPLRIFTLNVGMFSAPGGKFLQMNDRLNSGTILDDIQPTLLYMYTYLLVQDIQTFNTKYYLDFTQRKITSLKAINLKTVK